MPLLPTDFRAIARSLCRAKAFTLVTVATLALGIGAAAAIFHTADRILFLGPTLPGNVFVVGAADPTGGAMWWRFDVHLRAYRERPDVFAELAAMAKRTGNVSVNGKPVATFVRGITANLLPMLGVRPALGRGFLPGEDREGRNHVVIVTHDFWQQTLQGAADVLGHEIQINHASCTIVGVLPRDLVLPAYFESAVYQPLAYRPSPTAADPLLYVLARLQPGVSKLQAEAALDGIKFAYNPWEESNLGRQKPALYPLEAIEAFDRNYRGAAMHWALLGGAGLLFAISCLNATNLMLVRMLGRQRELGIRFALGGDRARLVRLFLGESTALAMGAGAAALLVANSLIPWFASLDETSGAAGLAWGAFDARTLLLVAGLTLLAGVVLAVAPTFQIWRTDIQSSLRNNRAVQGENRGLARLRGLLVVGQAAFAVVLLIGGGLMIRTLHNLQRIDLGFDPRPLRMVRFELPPGVMPDPEQRVALLHRLQERLQQVSGVEAVAYGTNPLLLGMYFTTTNVFQADGVTSLATDFRCLSPNFLETTGLQLKRGRWFAPGAAREVVISESLARVRYGDTDPVGQILKSTDADAYGYPGWIVAGVLGDLRERVRDPGHFVVYGPEKSSPVYINTLVLRVAPGDRSRLADAVHRTLFELDPRIVAEPLVSLDEARARQLQTERMALSALEPLAGLAILLAVVGLYSVIAYAVDQRRGEFGVRLALGATPGHLGRLVLGRAALLATTGIGTGIAVSFGLTGYLQSVLFETPRINVVGLLSVAGLVLVTALGACAAPALRATRTNIVQLLRTE